MEILVIIGKILLKLLQVLLILLFAVVVLVLVVLLLPVRYRIRLEQEEEWKLKGCLHWCLHIVHFSFAYQEGEFRQKLRIFGMNTEVFKKKKSVSDTENKKGLDESEKTDGQEKREERVKSVKDVESEETKKEYGQKEQIPEKQNQKEQNKKESPNRKNLKKARKPDFFGKVEAFWEKAKEVLQKIWRLRHKPAQIVEILMSDYAKASICLIKENMLHLWKQIKPVKIKSDILFGTGDPCTTGQALGAIAVAMAVLNCSLNITPDFEEEVLKGYLEIRGRIRILTLLLIIWEIYQSEDIRRFQKEVKGLKEGI